jgi:hypothetical protein
MQGNGREETAMIDLVVRGDTVVTPQSMSGCLSGRTHGPGGAITRAMMSWVREQM